jgi:hypothetical protein
MRGEERYIPINFVKDLRTHIARSERSNFLGYPLPTSTILRQRGATTHQYEQTNNKQIDASKQINCVALNEFIY